MIVQPETAGDYDLLFTEMNEAMGDLEDTETGAAIDLRETARLAEEIETLRAITEQVADDSGAMRSVTLG
jgi:hypothetical protein